MPLPLLRASLCLGKANGGASVCTTFIGFLSFVRHSREFCSLIIINEKWRFGQMLWRLCVARERISPNHNKKRPRRSRRSTIFMQIYAGKCASRRLSMRRKEKRPVRRAPRSAKRAPRRVPPARARRSKFYTPGCAFRPAAAAHRGAKAPPAFPPRKPNTRLRKR